MADCVFAHKKYFGLFWLYIKKDQGTGDGKNLECDTLESCQTQQIILDGAKKEFNINWL